MSTTADPARERENEFTARRHVYEPHRVGLPPMIPYVQELWRRREFAVELSRTNLRAQHFDTAFGQLWLILNPLLLGFVYFLLVDILHHHANATSSSRTCCRGCSSTTSSSRRSRRASSRSSRAAS